MWSEAQGRELVGRDVERALVCRVLADAVDAGSPRLLLIGGDAGIGKSALTSYAAARARASGFTVLEGACLDIAAKVPFGPVLEALRPQLVMGGTTDLGYAGEVAAALLRPDGSGPAVTAGQAAGCLREVISRCAGGAPTLLVMEDMHWADQSTQELAVSLAHTAAGPLVMLLTFRTEDLHRRHPFRAALLALGRAAGAERIDLGPMDRPALTELITELTGARPDPALVGAVLARCEGNPLFAEELLAAGPAARSLPTRLADLLLARVDLLSETGRRVVRAASAGGPRVDLATLPDVLGIGAEETEAAVREAIDLNVLSLRAGNLEFRHALVCEAVYEDLLPSERTRLHAAIALALQASLDDRAEPPTLQLLGTLAFHWYAAHHLPRALAAAAAAGRLALRYGACPEAIAHLDRAIALWDQVPGAADVAGVPRVELLRLAAEAATLGGDRDRGMALIDEASVVVDPQADPLLASRVYATRGSFCAGFDDALGELEAVERAVALAEGTASYELANALAVLAGHLASGRLRCTAAIEVSDRAQQVAEAAAADPRNDDPSHGGWRGWALTQARFAHGYALALTGAPGAGVEEMRAAITATRAAGRLADALMLTGALASLLFLVGRPEDALTAARAAADEADSAGLPTVGTFCGEQVVDVLTWRGDFAGAAALLEDLSARGLSSWRAEWYADTLALLRGDPSATELARESFDGWAARADLVLAGLSGPTALDILARTDPAGAVARVERIVGDTAGCDADFMVAAVTRAAVQALVAGSEAGVVVPGGLREKVLERLSALDAAASRGACPEGTMAAAELAAAKAWAQRLSGAPSVRRWQEAHEAWVATGYHFPALAIQVPLAEALLTSGDRPLAREVITRAWASSQQMGARSVAADLERLAGRARVRLAVGRTRAAGRLDRLTPREREVLDLIAAGASNRAVADALFISKKTASVHVSNLLAKLGVSSRLEAAALAHRLAPASEVHDAEK